ncbi:MAG: hypothetical protein IJC27_05215 [Lentisphaeria bacterium]|nr:hypothetical protein [Lentisphaeria bacterium]
MKKYPHSNESGMALVFAIGLLALLLLIGMAFVGNAVNYRRAAENNSSRSRARMFALSAVSRASGVLLTYAHQYAKNHPLKNFPESFDVIYSFAAYNDNGVPDLSGSNKYTDALKGNYSVMLIPEKDNRVGEATARKFNQQIKNNWPGNWVFFTNGGSGTNRRLIGRAAWQVIGESAQILAPVFMRGHIPLDDNNDDFVTSENRWGREIDEVFLGHYDGVWKPAHNLFGNLGEEIKEKTNSIKDYSYLYSVALSASSDIQRWMDKWFVPDFDEKATVAAPGTYLASETYSGLVRFNISELGEYYTKSWNDGNVAWRTAYDVNDGADQWYARLGIDTTVAGESSKINSEESIKLLSQDSFEIDDGEVADDSDLVKDGDINGLPFLRRIGNVSGTFADLAGLRKQIAANFNDYCDADGVPTSNIAAKDWMKWWTEDDITTLNDPLFTGNEKTPYLYELGMNFGFVSSESVAADADDDAKAEAAKIKAVKQDDGKFHVQAQIKAAPVVKLCNMYPFEPAAGDVFNTYVDFGKMEFSFKMKKVLLKDVTIEYYVKDDTVPEGKKAKSITVDIELDNLNASDTPADDQLKILTQTLTLSGEKWKKFGGTAGADKIVPLSFTDNEVRNADGTKGYPTKYSVDGNEDYWQSLRNESDTTFAFSYDFALADIFKDGDLLNNTDIKISKNAGDGSVADLSDALKGEFKNDVSVTTQPEKMEIQKIEVTKVSVDPQRMVLSLKNAAGDEYGIDYAVLKDFDPLVWDMNTVKTDGKLQAEDLIWDLPGKKGFALSGYRNIDPRQNLNKGDWYEPGTLIAKMDEFFKPETAFDTVLPEKSFVNKEAINYHASKETSPQNPIDGTESAVKDAETVTEPAYKGAESHISTAVIRNAPMMSPWEIGFIHRAAKWQTINIKKAGYINLEQHVSADSWNEGVAGSSYANGDGAVLDQIKMTGRYRSYGKINVNKLLPHAYNYDSARDPEILAALFRNVRVKEDAWDFIRNSSRGNDGKFLPEDWNVPSSKPLGETDITAIKNNFKTSVKNSGAYSSKLDFLNNTSLGNAFGAVANADQQTDAAREEVIGKTINLLCATSSTPSIIDIIVVAQSINDVDGTHIRLFDPADKNDYTNVPDGAELDGDDGVATHTGCKYGKFDFVEHSSEPGKNIYFDEITGEVKMLVRFHIDEKGRMSLKRINYL